MFEPATYEFVDVDLLELERRSDAASQLGVHFGGVALGFHHVTTDADAFSFSVLGVVDPPGWLSKIDGNSSDAMPLRR